MASRHVSLHVRLRRLESLRGTETSLPGVDREWQQVAAKNPEALRRARLLSARIQLLWPGGKPTGDEISADEECFEHLLFLEAVRAGGLANLMAPYLTDDG